MFLKFSKITILNMFQLKELQKELNIKLLKDKSELSNNPLILNHTMSHNNNLFNMFNNLFNLFNMFNQQLFNQLLLHKSDHPFNMHQLLMLPLLMLQPLMPQLPMLQLIYLLNTAFLLINIQPPLHKTYNPLNL